MPDYIPSDEMYKYIDCRYTGVVVAARRARQLMSEDPTNAKGKPLLRAFDELMQGKLQYRFVELPAQDEDQPDVADTTVKEPDDKAAEAERGNSVEPQKGTSHM